MSPYPMPAAARPARQARPERRGGRETRPCDNCGSPIFFARMWSLDDPTVRGYVALDADPTDVADPRGTWAVQGVGTPRARSLGTEGSAPFPDETRHLVHQATCTGRTRAGAAPAAAAAVAPARAQLALVADEDDVDDAQCVDDLLAELDSLVGLADVKAEIRRQAYLLRMAKLRAAAGMKNPTITRHLVFAGNPGTGKTTVARIVARIYQALGLLTRGHLVEVDRSDLVRKYIGHTTERTKEVVLSALGGVLFIDEAYALTPVDCPRDFGFEAVDTLVAMMENHRDDLVVIAAGYPGSMDRFLAANSGLMSRFRTWITFKDYTDDELIRVFGMLAAESDYAPTPGCLDALRNLLADTERGEEFGNGRWARNVLEGAVGRHAWRLRNVAQPTEQQMCELLAEDVE